MTVALICVLCTISERLVRVFRTVGYVLVFMYMYGLHVQCSLVCVARLDFKLSRALALFRAGSGPEMWFPAP